MIEEADQRELIEEAQNDVLRGLTKAPESPLAHALKFLTLDLGEKRFDRPYATFSIKPRGWKKLSETPADLDQFNSANTGVSWP